MAKIRTPTTPRLRAAREDARTGDDAMDADDVVSAIAQMGADCSRVWVWRRNAAGERAYITKVAAPEFDLDGIRAQYGGGLYLFRFQRQDGTWSGSESLRIEGAARADDVVPTADRSNGAPAWAAELMDVIREARETRTREDPMKIAAELGNVAAQNVASMLTMFTALLDRQPKPSSGAFPATKLLDAFTEGIRVGQGSGGGESHPASLLTSVAPRLLAIMERAVDRSHVPENGGANIAAANNGQEAAEVDTRWMPASDTPFAQLAPWMPRLAELAARKSDPALWAAVIEDQAGEHLSMLDSMVARLGTDRTMEHFFATFPAARAQADWWRQLFAELQDSGEETSTGGDDDGE